LDRKRCPTAYDRRKDKTRHEKKGKRRESEENLRDVHSQRREKGSFLSNEKRKVRGKSTEESRENSCGIVYRNEYWKGRPGKGKSGVASVKSSMLTPNDSGSGVAGKKRKHREDGEPRGSQFGEGWAGRGSSEVGMRGVWQRKVQGRADKIALSSKVSELGS